MTEVLRLIGVRGLANGFTQYSRSLLRIVSIIEEQHVFQWTALACKRWYFAVSCWIAYWDEKKRFFMRRAPQDLLEESHWGWCVSQSG